MPKKSHAAPFGALERIARSESVPSLEDFLALGRELQDARLDFFVRGAFSETTLPAIYAGILVKNSCKYHRMADSNARAGIQGVADVLAQLAKKPKFWAYVRDELVKFSGLVAEEIKSRTPFQAVPVAVRKGRRPTNTLLLDFDEKQRRKNPKLTDKEVLAAFRMKHAKHPIFESDDPQAALRAARSRRKKKPRDA
jgi:hypothetical protein